MVSVNNNEQFGRKFYKFQMRHNNDDDDVDINIYTILHFVWE